VALVPADVPVPAVTDDSIDGLGAYIQSQARALCDSTGGRLRFVEIDCTGLDEALRATPVPLSTMGRDLDDDPASFIAAAAAGRHAATLLSE
jgi:hypothetical protein